MIDDSPNDAFIQSLIKAKNPDLKCLKQNLDFHTFTEKVLESREMPAEMNELDNGFD
jgi:hypothetical protein